MSMFYQSMDADKRANIHFKAMKRIFKTGQPCVTCGMKLRKEQMTVDHIIPVRDPAVDPFDMTNWQVLCMPCHRAKNRQEARQIANDVILNVESEA